MLDGSAVVHFYPHLLQKHLLIVPAKFFWLSYSTKCEPQAGLMLSGIAMSLVVSRTTIHRGSRGGSRIFRREGGGGGGGGLMVMRGAWLKGAIEAFNYHVC